MRKRRAGVGRQLIPALFIASLIGGCARGPKVPPDAKLIWYGQTSFNIPAKDFPSGTYYMVEEETGRTVVALYRPVDGPGIHFNGLKVGRHYRLYFVEGSPATTRAVESSEATQGPPATATLSEAVGSNGGTD